MITRNLYQIYYSIMAKILNDVVSVNGVRIDLDDEVFSSSMADMIRQKKYETSETNLIQAHIRSDLPTIDLGAGVGYTTCVIDNITDSSTIVVGVEANELLIPVINRTKKINASDFEIVHSAYNSKMNTLKFHIAEDFWSSSQYQREDKNQKPVSVSTISLNDLINEYELRPPIQLVADIEGAEHSLILEEQNILQNYIELIIIEFHSFTNYDFGYYKWQLENIGFEQIESRGRVVVFKQVR